MNMQLLKEIVLVPENLPFSPLCIFVRDLSEGACMLGGTRIFWWFNGEIPV